MIDFTELDIRTTRYEDIEYIYLIEQDNFHTAWTENQLKRELDLKISECYSLFHLDSLIGYAVFWKIENEFELQKIAIAKMLQKSGIGSYFLNELIKIAYSINITIIKLEVSRANAAAIHLYKKFNFQIDGIRPNYYPEDDQDALLMSLKI